MSYIVEYNKKTLNKPDGKTDELLKKTKKEHEKLVKGRFEFVDAQGGWLDFTYRWFKDDPLIKLRLVHGEVYELPMGIVKHLNNTKKKIRKLLPNLGNDTDRNKQGYQLEFTSRVLFTPVDVL